MTDPPDLVVATGVRDFVRGVLVRLEWTGRWTLDAGLDPGRWTMDGVPFRYIELMYT